MSKITDIRIQNTGGAQTKVPFTFGQVFAVGDLAAGSGLAGALADGTGVPLQIDAKAAHADGSVRHAVISGVLPALAVGATATIGMRAIAAAPAADALPQNADTAAEVRLTLAGEVYTASLLGRHESLIWLDGPICSEKFYDTPLMNAAGAEHPHLAVRFGVRKYPGGRARVEFTIENTRTFIYATNFVYDVELRLGGKAVYAQKALTHYHHARWRRVEWLGAAPMVHIQHNTAYLIGTRAVSNYDQSLTGDEAILEGYRQTAARTYTGPMTIGPIDPGMPNTGGRPDIGSLPSWSVNYILSQDKRAMDMVIATGEGAASWSTHYRDENTGYPVRVDNEKNKFISLHMNMRHTAPLPVPRWKDGNEDNARSPYSPDAAHQPSMAYLPYLVTGEYYYLEELHFWAAWNPLETAPGYRGYDLGLLCWQQLRGQAWSMRTLGHAAYITPDDHYLKAYFVKQLDNNLDYYQKQLLAPTANEMGVYDGTYEGAFVTDGYSPWQDDFFTWSFGYLAELGFTKAEPILKWKAKYPVGRMTAPGFCWIQASKYFYNFSDGPGAPRYKTFAELYAGNFKEDNIRDDNSGFIKHPGGLKYNDQPCGSQEQADWFVAAGIPWWIKGRMVGYADSPLGYPANMQPALAVSADSGIADSAKAWDRFDGRSAKPNYNAAPQWAIVPRTIPSVASSTHSPVSAAPVPSAPTVPQLPPTTMESVDAPTTGTWERLGAENTNIDVAPGTIVRYGADGKYKTAKVGGPFTATNAFFGGDPIVNVVKAVDKFVPAAPAASVKPGKITTPSNVKLAKKTKLAATVFDAKTLEEVKAFTGVAATTKGVLSLSDATLKPGGNYAIRASDASGKVLDIIYPVTVKN